MRVRHIYTFVSDDADESPDNMHYVTSTIEGQQHCFMFDGLNRRNLRQKRLRHRSSSDKIISLSTHNILASIPALIAITGLFSIYQLGNNVSAYTSVAGRLISRETATKKYMRFRPPALRQSDRINEMNEQQQSNQDENEFRIVIIGGGWAGLSAADVLLSSSSQKTIRVDLIDASPQLGGLASGWRGNLNKSVEGGLHGFWREYRNTFSIIERICKDSNNTSDDGSKALTIDDILTPYTPSVLYSRRSGRVAFAPVVIDAVDDSNNSNNQVLDVMRRITSSNTLVDQKALLRLFATLLPAPLDIAMGSEFSSDSKLTLVDRISALSLLSIWANFDPSKVSSWDQFDNTSADTLFRGSAKISDTLYSELVEPLLSVLPMCPGYDCSAAAAISCFHAFALCRKGAFDVRWCRGTITDKIFTPWIHLLQQRAIRNENSFKIRSSSRVNAITETMPTRSIKKNQFVVSINNEDNETITCDAIVFAVGIGGAQKLRETSPPLQAISSTKRWDQLRAISCVCVRLFLNSASKFVEELNDHMKDSPVAVCGPNMILPELSETGFCIYDLQRLQDEFNTNDATDMTVIEVDYYRATNALINLPNSEIAALTLRAISEAMTFATPLESCNDCVLDVSVIRARNAVSHFSVGSASCTPSSVTLRSGLYICGDWIDRKGHASWSTEKAVVTGRQAATMLASDFDIDIPRAVTQIIPAAPDTAELAVLRKVKNVMRLFIRRDIEKMLGSSYR